MSVRNALIEIYVNDVAKTRFYVDTDYVTPNGLCVEVIVDHLHFVTIHVYLSAFGTQVPGELFGDD